MTQILCEESVPVSYTHLAYRVTVAYGDIDLPADATAKVEAPVGEGQDVPAPLEGKFFLTKNAQETPIKVGDKVKKGDLLCYIEAMKTYNAIRADFDGTVTAICATSGLSLIHISKLLLPRDTQEHVSKGASIHSLIYNALGLNIVHPITCLLYTSEILLQNGIQGIGNLKTLLFIVLFLFCIYV